MRENNTVATFGYGKAIELLKAGRLCARNNWNGKGMFVFMRPSDQLTETVVTEHVKSLPESYKEWVRKHPSLSGVITFNSYLCLKSADGTVINGWVASQTDVLADDWVEILP